MPGSLPTETYAVTVAASRTGCQASATSATDDEKRAAASSGRRLRPAITWSRSALLANRLSADCGVDT